jgi:hypothetical protein
MGIIAPAYVTVNPHYMEPGLLVAQSQVSGAFELLPDGKPSVRLEEDTLAVYLKRLDFRSKVASGQAAYNMLPSVNLAFSYISTPTYLTRCRAEYDHHDTAAAGRWNIGIQQAYRLGMRQSHFNFMRQALLYGVNPAFGEGIVNAAGATAVNLPADTNGNTTIVTYDNGQIAQYLLSLIFALKTRTNQIGVGQNFTILAPQRILGQWEYSVVQLVQYQRAGAGTETSAGMVKLIGEVNDDTIKWVADDTLIGKGNGGNDLVILVMPDLEVVDVGGEINTNEFAKTTPNVKFNTAMYCDMVAPREITAPLPGGAVDVLSEHRITAGWGVRPEAVTLLSVQYQ